MKIPYQVFIALRYLKSRKRHKGISFNTAISIGGVSVGVMALLIVLSVMSGFHEDLQKKILGISAHAVILDYKGSMQDYEAVMSKVKEEPHVNSASPFILGQVMVSYEEKAQGAVFKGIEPALEAGTTDIKKYLKEGSLEDLKEIDGIPWVLVGKEMAGRLGIWKNDRIKIISPMGEIGPLGMLPKVKTFRVAGIFDVGMFEYDSNLVIVGISSAQDFLGMGQTITGIELRVEDIYKAKEISKGIQEKLGYPYYTRDWIEMNRNLFAALKLEKLAMFIILTLIVLVAAFNIVSTLIMNVIEKEREIAILKAIGAGKRGIMSIFMLQGFLIGLLGTAVGLFGGYVLGYVINTYEIIKLPPDVYYLSHLPVKMKLSDFVAVSVSAVVISFIATIYPSWQAAKLNPIEPLRYE